MDFTTYLQFALALIFVLGLIALLAWLLRRYGMGLKMSKGRRLGVVEVQSLGPRHRLILLRRDQVEHLVIIGPHSETVVETGIKALDGGAPTQTFAATLAAEEPKA